MGVFQENLGGPDLFTPREAAVPESGSLVTAGAAVVAGGLYQVTDFTTDPWTINVIQAGAANSTSGFLAAATEAGSSGDEVHAQGSGKIRLRMRRNDASALPRGTRLWCTEGQNWVTPVLNAGGSTSGRLCASVWDPVAAGGAQGDFIEIVAVLSGAPPHLG